MWCVGAGVLLSVVLASAAALLVHGILAEVKLWFLGRCWALLLAPWFTIGLVGRRLLRAGACRRAGVDTSRGI
jgi:hypothetical protein